MRAPRASASARVELALRRQRLQRLRRSPLRAFSAAPMRVSNRRTGGPPARRPARCPTPIAPAPMTATVASRGNAPAVMPIAVTSAAGEARRALVEERGDAFAIVGAAAELALQRRARASSCASSVLPADACSARLIAASPRVGACASCASSASTVGREARASSTHFQISPHSAACSAESLSPSIASPIARARADEARQEVRAAGIGDRPILQNAWMKLADRAAMTMSQASAMFAPAPAATPLTAHTTGNGSARSAEHQRPIVALDRCAEVDGRGARRHGAIGQVLPGAKAASCAGQQQHARVAVGRDARQRIAQLGVHLRREAVQPVRTIERDARDAVAHCRSGSARSSSDRLLRMTAMPAASRMHARGAGRRGSGWRRMRRRSAPRWPPDWRRCRENRRTPPTG